MTEIGHKTLYVSDMDGTLLAPDGTLSEETCRLLNEIIRKGGLFTVATARTPATVADLLKDVDISIPLCVTTGSALWNPADGKYSNIHYIAENQVRKAIEIYRRHNLSTFIFTLEDNTIQLYHLGSLNELEKAFLEARSHTPYKNLHITPENPDLLPEHLDKVLLFYSMNPSEASGRVTAELRENLDCVVNFYHDIYGEHVALLELFAEGSSKARAITDLAAEVGADRIVAFGDNVNDIPLLKIADESVAVENAVPELKRIADRIIGPNSADSVPKAILRDMERENQR